MSATTDVISIIIYVTLFEIDMLYIMYYNVLTSFIFVSYFGGTANT